MTIACPRCGLAFETRATTNTRCRRCRHVVRIGRSAARSASEQLERAASDDEIAPDPTPEQAFAAVLTVASVVAGVLTLAVARIVEARRRHAGPEAPMLGSDGP